MMEGLVGGRVWGLVLHAVCSLVTLQDGVDSGLIDDDDLDNVDRLHTSTEEIDNLPAFCCPHG